MKTYYRLARKKDSHQDSDERIPGRGPRRSKDIKRLLIILNILLISASMAQFKEVHAHASGAAPTADTSLTRGITKETPRFVAVEAGDYYSAGLRSDGSVWVWGRNMLGELGLQETVTYTYTNGPVRLSGLSDVKSISINGGWKAQNLAVKADGTVWQWGRGESLQPDDGKIHSLLPEKIEGITDAVMAVGDGAYGSYGYVLKQNGTVWSWNRPGKKADLTEAKGLNQVVQIEPHSSGILAVKKNGTVWYWERNDKNKKSPTKVQGLSNIRYISASSKMGSYIALDKQGKAWAPNEKGKISKFQPKLTLKEVRAEASYTLLLTTSGEVYTYGKTATGKQGKVNGLPKITAIGAGGYHNLFIDEAGRIWGMGADKFMEIGAPPTTPEGMVYAPIQAMADVDVVINGQLQLLGFTPVVTAKSVQLPVRKLAEVLSASYIPPGTNAPEPVHMLKYKDKQGSFLVGNDAAKTDHGAVTLPEAPMAYVGATTIPYQLLEELGLNVTWDSTQRLISIQGE